MLTKLGGGGNRIDPKIFKGSKELQNLKNQGAKRHTNRQIDRAKFRIETRRQNINRLIALERQASQFN